LDKLFSQKFARFISTLFVPPSFTILIFVYYAFKLENNFSKQIILIAVALIFGFILHIALFVLFKKKGRLVDMDATIKEERTTPFLISCIFYIIGLVILITQRIDVISSAFWFCYISNIIVVIAINKFWKISVHALGSSGALAALFFVAGPVGLFFILIPLLVGWSRVKLKCHTVSQVFAGAALGFCSVYLQMFLIVKWLNYGW
jgi:membrane-associated phospholipid phosphatase